MSAAPVAQAAGVDLLTGTPEPSQVHALTDCDSSDPGCLFFLTQKLASVLCVRYNSSPTHLNEQTRHIMRSRRSEHRPTNLKAAQMRQYINEGQHPDKNKCICQGPDHERVIVTPRGSIQACPTHAKHALRTSSDDPTMYAILNSAGMKIAVYAADNEDHALQQLADDPRHKLYPHDKIDNWREDLTVRLKSEWMRDIPEGELPF